MGTIMRRDYFVNDTQIVFYYLFKSLISAAAATSIYKNIDLGLGWPTTDVDLKFVKPKLMIDEPVFYDPITQAGGGNVQYNRCEILLHIWTDIHTGNREEANLLSAKIISLFNNANTAHKTTFSCVIGGTTYTSQTMKTQGIKIIQANGPRVLEENTDLKTTRHEITVNFKLYIN